MTDTPAAADLTRRNLLAAAAVAPVAVIAPVTAQAAMPSDDPLPDLVEEWRTCMTALEAQLDGDSNWNAPAALALDAERDRLEDLIEESVATSWPGLQAQIFYLTEAYFEDRDVYVFEGPTRLLKSLMAATI